MLLGPVSSAADQTQEGKAAEITWKVTARGDFTFQVLTVWINFLVLFWVFEQAGVWKNQEPTA